MGSSMLIFTTVSLFFAGIGLLYYNRLKQQVAIAHSPNSENTKIGSSKILLTKSAVLEEK